MCVCVCHIQGVIPSAPDAWIWVGDMAYVDDPEVCVCMCVRVGARV